MTFTGLILNPWPWAICYSLTPQRTSSLFMRATLRCTGVRKIPIPEISKLSEIWLGEVASIGIPGKKKQATDLRLDLSEWCHSYFLQLPLNDKKTVNPPKEPVTIINRWWFTDYETKRNRRPHPDWPDIIDYWGKEVWQVENR